MMLRTMFSAPLDPVADTVRAAAERLLGGGGMAIDRVSGGGNNRLYRVASGGFVGALKFYPRVAGDQRDRLQTEFAALNFMTANGIIQVPTPIAADPEGGCALYSWIEGTGIGQPEAADIDAAAAFVPRLDHLTDRPAAVGLAPASEACLSGDELERQLRQRLERLRAIPEPELAKFLDAELTSALEQSIRQARSSLGNAFDATLPAECRTLSPSDFGFHNALRGKDGKLVFLDFEYFGWDDPAKLVCDFMLHPGMSLTPMDRQRFFTRVAPVWFRDRDFMNRVRSFHPLYRLRWCLIILNEFLPERWQRRALAGGGDQIETQARQLAKARRLLEDINEPAPFPQPA